MSQQRTLYSPRLENELIRRLYREARRQGRTMTLVLDQIVRNALPDEQPAPRSALPPRPPTRSLHASSNHPQSLIP